MDSDTKSAANVVKQYFKCIDEQNIKGEEILLTDKFKKNQPVHKSPNLKSMKLLVIREASDSYKEDYVDKENTKVFKVIFNRQFVDDDKAVVDSGIGWWDVIVIREDKNSPWRIDGVGVC